MSAHFEAFSARLTEAMSAKRMSLSELRARLAAHGNPMSISALSYWRSGSRKPEGAKSMSAVADIEAILGMEPGSLSAVIPHSSRGGSAPPRHFTDGIEPIAEVIDDMAVTLLSDPLHAGREIATHITAEVDERGLVRRQVIRAQVQAVTTAITQMVWAEVPPLPSDVAPVFSSVAGCTLARTLDQPDSGGFAALFALDRTVPPGEMTMIEFQMDFPDGYPRLAACEHITSRKTREIVLWVRFTAETVPDWIEESEIVDGVTTRRARQVEGLAVHVARTGFAPGMLSLHWGYDADAASVDH